MTLKMLSPWHLFKPLMLMFLSPILGTMEMATYSLSSSFLPGTFLEMDLFFSLNHILETQENPHTSA